MGPPPLPARRDPPMLPGQKTELICQLNGKPVQLPDRMTLVNKTNPGKNTNIWEFTDEGGLVARLSHDTSQWHEIGELAKRLHGGNEVIVTIRIADDRLIDSSRVGPYVISPDVKLEPQGLLHLDAESDTDVKKTLGDWAGPERESKSSRDFKMAEHATTLEGVVEAGKVKAEPVSPTSSEPFCPADESDLFSPFRLYEMPLWQGKDDKGEPE